MADGRRRRAGRGTALWTPGEEAMRYDLRIGRVAIMLHIADTAVL